MCLHRDTPGRKEILPTTTNIFHRSPIDNHLLQLPPLLRTCQPLHVSAPIQKFDLVVLSLTVVISRIFLYLYPRTTASRSASLLISADICRLIVKMFDDEQNGNISASETERKRFYHANDFVDLRSKIRHIGM
jgi:hypothetical protein